MRKDPNRPQYHLINMGWLQQDTGQFMLWGIFVVIGVVTMAVTAIVLNTGYTTGYDANFCGPGTHYELIGPPPNPGQGDPRVSQCLPNVPTPAGAKLN